MPGEPCHQRPHPWDDPPAGFDINTQNLPQCPSRELEHIDWTTVPEGGLHIVTFDGGLLELHR